MTPIQQAKDLIYKMEATGIDIYDSKPCAIITCNLLIENLPSKNNFTYLTDKIRPEVKEYWMEVKQEIQKL